MTTRDHRRSIFIVWLFATLIAGCQSPSQDHTPKSPTPPELKFDQHDLSIGTTERQTVLTGFLLGRSTADLAVLHIGENATRHLHIYSLGNDGWKPRLETTLRPNVRFVDVATIAGRDRLLTYEPGRLNWFDPATATGHKLASVTTNFEPPRKNEIPHVDITRDLNGDGRDDLALPTANGFKIFVQSSRGSFSNPVEIGPPADLARIYGADGYRYDPWSQSRIYPMDHNRDGRTDLVYWNRNHFHVHTQRPDRRFEPEPTTFTANIPIDSADPSSLAVGTNTGRVILTIDDLNDDGFADLVVHSLQGKRVSKKLSEYQVHFGIPAPGGRTTFDEKIGMTFRSSDRVLLAMHRQDFDGDGRLDIMLTSIERRFLHGSPWKSLKGFMGDDIGLGLEFYRNDNGTYTNKPTTTRGIGLDGAPSHREPGHVPIGIVLRGATHQQRRTQKIWPRAFNPTTLIGDLTGDGRAELLVEGSFRGLDLSVGVPPPDLFARHRPGIEVTVPHDIEYNWLTDLNNDGKQDILLHHPFIHRDVHGGRINPPGTDNQQVTTLIAR